MCSDHEAIWCESCGEAPQEVSSTHAGLCGDCYGASISEVVKDATGDHICGHPLYYNGRVFAICCLPHGQEHDHGTIAYLSADDGWTAAELQRVRDRANNLECLLAQAVEDWPQFDSDDDVSGADLVEWFGQFRQRAKAAIDA